MSNPPQPPNRPNRQIRGPQSALTSYLAANNIDANRIRQEANARRAAALAARQADDDNDDEALSDVEPAPARRSRESKAQVTKKKQAEKKSIAKIKASKAFQHKRRFGVDSDNDGTDEDEAARELFEEEYAPLPGQMSNCEMCNKRFSVTSYSRAGPDGGLLCTKCSKNLDKEEGQAKKKRKKAVGRARRQVQSNLLDGIYPGAKDLMTLCIETLAKNVNQAESLGDLPASLVNKLAAILSKRRLMSSKTLDLFLRPGSDSITVFDGAKLSPDDYIRIFQVVPTVKHLRLRNAVQFKNVVMDHLLGTTVELETLSLHGSNLIDDGRWNRYLSEKGAHLKSLKVYYFDGHFGDEQLLLLTKACPQLQCLKVCHNQKVTDSGIEHISNLPNLERLSLEITKAGQNLTSKPLVKVLNSIGVRLCVLSLATFNVIDDTVLRAIHDNCHNLFKLRITDNEVLTDAGFTQLFTGWLNHPLTYIDLHKCRHIDSEEPRNNSHGVGFASAGFEALMAHSGKKLKHLNIHSCRHISQESFETVFAADKKYEALESLDVSFCQSVNDFVVGCIFRSCPNLKTLKVFGNFGVANVKVPQGKILIGVPNALGMRIEGTEDGEGRTI